MAVYQDPTQPFIPDRTHLPIHEPLYEPVTVEMVADGPPPPPPRFTVKAPEGAPNVVIFLIDDMGYGATSAFGGPIPMPTAERLAKNGMKFNRFHTTSICAPTRAALLSGYNHHSVNMGNITELGTAYPGNLSTRPKSVTPMARVLRDNGYSTAQFGKCHETPTWETTVSGPFDHWPTFSGFDKFYGFLAAETNQYHPALVDGVVPIDPPDREDYHLTEDLADKCIEWMHAQKALTPEKPMFVYFAPGATHAPHHAPEKYRDMYKGKYDEGWDVIRQRTHENMLKMGIIPAGSKIADKPADIPDWDTLSDMEKELYAREMEIYAGYAHHTDENIGRVVDALEKMEILDNTVIFYILGDNGASCEGLMNGVVNENSTLNHVLESAEYVHSKMDILGTEEAYNHYSMGWAIAMDSPFMWAKTTASNFGGTRNGMIFHCPAKYKGNGEVHSQFHHVIDVAPTVYELAGIPQPKTVDGIEQKPVEGTSMVYALQDAAAKGRHETQYFNVFSNFGVYHDEWFAGVVNKAPWAFAPKWEHLEDCVWELYNLKEDFACAHDLADQYPEKLEEMKKVYHEEGVKHNVFPMDGRSAVLLNDEIAERPTVLGKRKDITMHEGFKRVNEHAFLNLKNHSYTITAEVEVRPGKATDGVIFALGGQFGGLSLYVKDGVPTFCYNFTAMEKYYIRSSKKLADERNQIVVDFVYDGTESDIGKGGNVTMHVNNEKVGEGRVEKTMGMQMTIDEGADVGQQGLTAVSDEYTVKTSKFQGNIFSVNVRVND